MPGPDKVQATNLVSQVEQLVYPSSSMYMNALVVNSCLLLNTPMNAKEHALVGMNKTR
jgi:hypothetical protein